MFSTLLKTNLNFSVTFILSSTNAFNLDQSQILLFDKEIIACFFTRSSDSAEEMDGSKQKYQRTSNVYNPSYTI